MQTKCGICGHYNCYAGGFKHPTKLFRSREHPYILGRDCIHEDELPEMTDAEYTEWFKQSEIVFGVRMGPMFPPSKSAAINQSLAPVDDKCQP